MKKFEQLLTTLIDESTTIDADNGILKFKVPKYNLEVVMNNLVNNHVTVDFITRNGSSSRKEVKIYTTIPEIKDVLYYYYQKHTMQVNKNVIEQMGLETVERWIAEDFTLLKNPILCPENPINYENDGVEKKVYLNNKNQYTNMVEVKRYLINDGEEQQANEVMYFPLIINDKPAISSIKASSTHFYYIGDTLYTRQIILHIPMCDLENYPVINNYDCRKERLNPSNGFEKLMELDTSLGKLVNYIHLENTLEVTGKSQRKNKI